MCNYILKFTKMHQILCPIMMTNEGRGQKKNSFSCRRPADFCVHETILFYGFPQRIFMPSLEVCIILLVCMNVFCIIIELHKTFDRILDKIIKGQILLKSDFFSNNQLESHEKCFKYIFVQL